METFRGRFRSHFLQGPAVDRLSFHTQAMACKYHLGLERERDSESLGRVSGPGQNINTVAPRLWRDPCQ